MGVIGRLARRAALLGVAVLAVTVVAVLYLSDRHMELHGHGRSLAEPVDAAIVLGAAVDGDGVLGYSSRRRVKVGVALLEQGKTRNLILSGGGAHPGRFPSVGELMRDHAVALGAPAEALLVEPDSVSTFENLRFSFALARGHGFERLAIVTDAFHLERARLLAAFFGRPDIGLAAAPGLDRDTRTNRVGFILREALAWWLNLGKAVAWELLAAGGVGPETRQDWIR